MVSAHPNERPEITTIDPAEARGIRGVLCRRANRNYGMVPGILRIVAVDLRIGQPAGTLDDCLHVWRKSSLSRPQREMPATAVNGEDGGAP